MKYENLPLIAKIFCLKSENKNWKEIAILCNSTKSKVRHHYRQNKEIVEKLCGPVAQLAEARVLNTLRCGFESHQAYHKTYIRPTKEQLQEAVKASYNYSEVLRNLDLDYDNNNHRRKIYALIKEYNIDVSNLKKIKNSKKQTKYFDPDNPFETLFVKGSSRVNSSVKKYLYKLGLKKEACEVCKIVQWNGKPIGLELHHIDGDPNNNLVENLQILCPNCHAQTDNFKRNNAKLKL